MKKTKRKSKKILIIAGPNGAGKTTFATEFLPREGNCINFVNADLIAAAYSPFAPELAAVKAARSMIAELHSHAEAGRDFAFETTLSGKTYASLISHWQNEGYRVKLFFLQLASADIAVERVRRRVIEGGHNVQEDTIRRRFDKGLRNLHEIYLPIVDEWIVYDNSGPRPRRVDGSKQK